MLRSNVSRVGWTLLGLCLTLRGDPPESERAGARLQELTDVLAAHAAHWVSDQPNTVTCSCAAWTEPVDDATGGWETAAGHRRHVADAVLAVLGERVATLTAERDRLLAELTAVAEQSAVANPYWRIRSDRHEAERDALAAQLARTERAITAARVLRIAWLAMEDADEEWDDDTLAKAHEFMIAVRELDGTAGPGEEGGDG